MWHVIEAFRQEDDMPRISRCEDNRDKSHKNRKSIEKIEALNTLCSNYTIINNKLDYLRQASRF